MNDIYDNDSFFDAYAQMPRSKEGLKSAGEWHQLQPLFPELAGKQVLDLGCGYGWHCKYCADQGAANVLGIDLSERMIETARSKNSAPHITYKVCSLMEYDYPKDTFDLVVSNLVLHYVKNLQSVYQMVYRTLKTNGIFLFNIEHPVFTAGIHQEWVCDHKGTPLYWPVDQYYYPGERVTNFLGYSVEKQHHTLTQILNGLLTCGFLIEAVEEAMPPNDMLELPGMMDEMRRPMMLLVRARKKA